MRTRRLHPLDEPADLATVLPVVRDYFARSLPGFPEFGPDRVRFWMSDGYRSRCHVHGLFGDADGGGESEGRAGDGPVLAALILNFDDDTNRNLANAFFAVSATAGEDGSGAFLVREALRLAAADGRTLLSTDYPATARLDSLFIEAGGRKVATTTRSVLDLSTVDDEQYEAWAAGSAKNAGYRLVRWGDHCPDELIETFCTAMDAMRDAPLEEMTFKHPKATLERLRGREEHSARFGIRRHVLAALDADGNVAGFNIFVTVPDEPETIEIWDTAVLEKHRGHGLGLRIKAAATLWMRQQYPEARWVETFNNHGNTHMLNVNRTMGYRKSEDWPAFEFATGA